MDEMQKTAFEIGKWAYTNNLCFTITVVKDEYQDFVSKGFNWQSGYLARKNNQIFLGRSGFLAADDHSMWVEGWNAAERELTCGQQ